MRRIAGVNGSAQRVNPNLWRGAAIGVFGIAVLAALAASLPARESSAAPQCPFTIDFAGLPAGTILGEQYEAQGVHISGVGRLGTPDALIVFDTNAPPTHDPDLAVDIGNIAIFAKNLTDVVHADGTNGPDGLVDDPDENDVGGTATFAFDQDVSIGSVKWIDKDHVANNFVIAYNAAGEVIVSVPVPLGANSSVQTIAINADGVRRLVLDYQASGGFTEIEVDCEQATPTPTAQAETPTPTAPVPTPTPTDAPTPTPSPAPATPTPPVATSTVAPPTNAPSPTPGVAAATSTPVAGTSTGTGPGAGALPVGGGAPSPTEGFRWTAPLLALALVLVGTWYARRGQGR